MSILVELYSHTHCRRIIGLRLVKEAKFVDVVEVRLADVYVPVMRIYFKNLVCHFISTNILNQFVMKMAVVISVVELHLRPEEVTEVVNVNI